MEIVENVAEGFDVLDQVPEMEFADLFASDSGHLDVLWYRIMGDP